MGRFKKLTNHNNSMKISLGIVAILMVGLSSATLGINFETATSTGGGTVLFGNLTNISQMADVDGTSWTNGHALTYSSAAGKWISAAISGSGATWAEVTNGTMFSWANWNTNYTANDAAWRLDTDTFQGNYTNFSTIYGYAINGSGGTTWGEIVNGTLFSQADWDTNYTANDAAWRIDTDTFTANYSTFLTLIGWTEAINGTLMSQADWDTNYTANNELWLNTTNLTYAGYNSTGLIINWSSTGDTRWVNVDGDIMAGDLYFENAAINNTNYVQFNTSWVDGSSEGRLQWNSEDGTLEVGLPGGNVNLQIGQELILRATNDQGTQINNGQLVRISGGTGDFADIKLADKSSIATAGTIGMATEDILDGQKGYITKFGLVRDVNTSGMAAGSLLWLGDDGEYSTTVTSSPDIKVVVGTVVRSHETAGIILVTLQQVPRLSGLSEVDSTGKENNSILQYNSDTSNFEMTTSPTFNNVTANVFYGDVKIDTINGQTYQYLQDWIDITQSAGKVSGGTFTSNGDGTVNISAGSGFIKTSNLATANTILFDWDMNTSVGLTDNSTNYIYIDYNSGTPMVKSSVSKVNNRDKILLGKIFREGTTLHTYEAGMLITELAKNTLGRFTSVDGEFTRASGLILSETGVLNIAMTSGVAWGGLTMVNIAAFNSSTDTYELYYYDGVNWQETDINQINNTHYNNIASGLVELTTNRYGVQWAYVDNDGHVMVVYGQGDYTLANAEASQPPSDLPSHVTDFGELIGRIIVQKDSLTFYSVDIPSAFIFTSTGATDYNSLSNTPTSLTDFINDLGYTNNLNFTNGANYWNDTYATFNKTYADTLYARIQWDYNQTTPAIAYADSTFMTWTEAINGTLMSQADWDTNYTANDAAWRLDTDTWAGNFTNYLTSADTIVYINANDTTYNNSMKAYVDGTFLTAETFTQAEWDTNYTANDAAWRLDTDTFLGNYSDYLSLIGWTEAGNGTLLSQDDWDANYTANDAAWRLDTNTQLSEATVDGYCDNNGYLETETFTQTEFDTNYTANDAAYRLDTDTFAANYSNFTTVYNYALNSTGGGSGMDYTNLALTNISETFDYNLNVTGNLTIGDSAVNLDLYYNGTTDLFDTKGNNAVFTDNVTADYFLGDGSQLTGLTSSGITWAAAINGTLMSQADFDTNYTTNDAAYRLDTDTFASNYSTFLTHIGWAQAINGTLFTQLLWNTNYTANNAAWLENTQLSEATVDGYCDDNGYLTAETFTQAEFNTNYTANDAAYRTDTTYSAGNGIALSTTTFSVAGGTALTQDAGGLSVTAGGIGDTQIADAYINQALTTTSNVNFNNATIADCIVFASGGQICSGS